ncbi:RDD family protein [Streptomyces coeruleoprunus]|uniref:RDD family protein n=1 Tax=Streptomyces coeruleoprunus TaxID=285563 RepID=A0ABV9XPC3_9ACTN
MSAPTPATGDGSPQAGYYPDPSIPGYIRYWNGAAWVPGTSRPAPKDGEAMPTPPASAVAAAPAPAPSAPSPAPVPAVEETGPVFLDEEPDPAYRTGPEPEREAERASRPDPEPASAWQADASRQTGFGGDRDRRVSWGSEGARDPRLPAAAADPTGGALPGVRRVEPEAEPAAPTPRAPVAEGTVTIRATQPRTPQQQPQSPRNSGAPQGPQLPAQPQAQAQAQAQARPAAQQAQQQPGPAQAAAAATPLTSGPGGGASSWAQQVHQLAQPQVPAQPQQPQAASPAQQHVPAAAAQPVDPAGNTPVMPWKPPVDDPFLRAAQAQANARPAGLGKRLVARLVDTVVLGALVGAAAAPFVMSGVDHIIGKIEQAERSGETVTVWLIDSTTSLQFGIALALLLVLGGLYEALPTAKWGRTLGKKLCGIQVRDIESHEPPSFGAALRRWLVYGVLGLLVVGIGNVLWCLFDRPWRQCWHDKAARTFVAKP